MNKATIFTTDGSEIETEYEWIAESYTTITFLHLTLVTHHLVSLTLLCG